jgi:single-strand DNA-binding protein
MKSINKVFLVGRLGADPEMKVTKNGKTYARLSLATQRPWQPSDGKNVIKTDWHNVTVWGGEAERCASLLSKGSPVFVEGHISKYQLPTEEGEPNRYITSITADQLSFLTMPLNRIDIREDAVLT